MGLRCQGLFVCVRRKEQQRRYCDSFQQFLGLSRLSPPLPHRLHLPRCGGGSAFVTVGLAAAFFWSFKQSACVPPDLVL